jgi:hypothetical protein
MILPPVQNLVNSKSGHCGYLPAVGVEKAGHHFRTAIGTYCGLTGSRVMPGPPPAYPKDGLSAAPYAEAAFFGFPDSCELAKIVPCEKPSNGAAASAKKRGARLARRGDEMTASIFGKIAVAAGLAILTLGVFPDRLRGAILAIGIAIAAAVVLHFAAP